MVTKYVTRATVDEYGDADAALSLATTVYEHDRGPIDTGLLDAKGRQLFRIDEREPIGFGRPKR